jgi:hypothetical protein
MVYKEECDSHNDPSMIEMNEKEDTAFVTLPPVKIEVQVSCISVVGANSCSIHNVCLAMWNVLCLSHYKRLSVKCIYVTLPHLMKGKNYFELTLGIVSLEYYFRIICVDLRQSCGFYTTIPQNFQYTQHCSCDVNISFITA